MTDWVFRLLDEGGYWGVMFLMFIETVFPPIPSEVIMSLAGVRAGQGTMSLWGVIAAGTAGAMFGNFFWYLLARVIGIERFRPLIERYGRWITVDWPDVEKAERLFGRYGGLIVGLGRMMPTIRSVISIPAGLLHMRLKTFLLWSTVGTAGWSAGLAIAGYFLGQRFAEVDKILGPLSIIVIAAILLLYVWRQLTWRKRHPNK
ncbi:DedA family protein [Allosphingosinicella indica]|uniref:Membrane protein DedA, SNARE-associated domain n=1 Tax=Allosphingosinicella indica TaxID=941907 RepID=A0A1X7GZR8_9SPHN|nr:DedA family protein [Allosphingosinicella indica]SMF77134.1 membrane protein DedA, SNARE-associated domain [Allosphingosinicella indica]